MIRLTTTTALLTLLAAPAAADVTAPDVWNGFTALYQSIGLKVEATQTRDGSTTTITDLKISGDFPFGLGSISISSIGPDLIGNGDGTVTIKFADHMPIAVAMSLPDDPFVTANLDYNLEGYTAVASGNPDDFTVEYSGDKMAVTLADVSWPNPPISDIEGSYTLLGFSGSSRFVIADNISVSQEYTATKMEIEVGLTVPLTLDKIHLSESWDKVADEFNYTLPVSGIDLMNLPEQLRNGLSIQDKFSIGSAKGTSHTTRNGETVEYQFDTTKNSVSTVSLSQFGIGLEAAVESFVMDYQFEELPFPIKAKAASANGRLNIPLLHVVENQKFDYALSLNDVTLGDEIWSQFDPDGKLPRTPANIALDFSGKGRLFVDLLDFDAMAKVIDEGIKFGELSALTINKFDVDAVGSRLISSGAFTFDNDDFDTFDGIPAPTGTATMHFAGMNALIDTLIDIGLLDSEKALGLRMGLGMFTVLGDGNDTLVSEIEISEDGHVSANGKRLN